jgi:hypothetical protein
MGKSKTGIAVLGGALVLGGLWWAFGEKKKPAAPPPGGGGRGGNPLPVPPKDGGGDPWAFFTDLAKGAGSLFGGVWRQANGTGPGYDPQSGQGPGGYPDGTGSNANDQSDAGNPLFDRSNFAGDDANDQRDQGNPLFDPENYA